MVDLLDPVHDPEYTQSRIDTYRNGDKLKWIPSTMAMIPNGYNAEWIKSRIDIVPKGHYSEWTPTRM